MIFAAQIRAARGLLKISQVELSLESALSLQTIKNFEKDDEAIRKASFMTLEKVKTTLENRGVRFTFSKERDESGKSLEIGVKLRTINPDFEAVPRV
jgi:transcriptional regulator with XRE-family HTH domain